MGPTAEPPSHAIDIGGNHMIEFVTYQGDIAGINDYHRRKSDGAWCRGWVMFNGSSLGKQFNNQGGWDVTQREPLTISPSMVCRSCGDHGFIQNGKWVPA